jgi:hypothetical protein
LPQYSALRVEAGLLNPAPETAYGLERNRK